MPKPLSERLRDARVKRKRSQKAVADALGVTQSAVSLWESGATIPRNHVDGVEREYGIRITRADLIGEAA